MSLLRRLLHAAAAGTALVLIGLPSSYCSSKVSTFAGVNESGTIVVFNSAKAEDSPFSDIYPADGKIEGRKVVKLNPAGINSQGQVVGLCTLDESPRSYPFVREPDGRFWLFKTPSSSGEGEFTDISDSGKAVGFYEKEKAKAKLGFLMDSEGKWVMDIRYPSNSCEDPSSYLHTQPNGINDKDEIVGNYECTERPDHADPLFKGNGFYRAPDGTFYSLQYENAARTVAGKISNTGIIFGYYVVDNDTWIPFAAPRDELIRSVVR